MFNFVTNLQSCDQLIKDVVPVALMMYSHIPISIIALIVGFFVLIKGERKLLAKILFSISILFSLWSLGDLVTWISTNSIWTMFAWAIMGGILDVLIFMMCLYFIYVFIFKKDISLKYKILLNIPFIIILILTPTTYNLSGFNYINCEAVEYTPFTYYYYGLCLFFILLTMIISVVGYKVSTKDYRKPILFLILGSGLFMSSFFITGFLSSYLGSFTMLIYGLLGMVIFMAFIAYLIVKFKTFDIKLIAAQALVWSSILLIGSQFTFVQNSINRILTAITLVISAILGLMIIRSVKKEVVLREQLEIANVGQTNLIHIMNHQIKGHLTVNKNIFAELLTEDYGKMPDAAKELITQGFANSDKGTRYVTDILKGASAENGTLMYDMKDIDFKVLVLREIEDQKKIIEKKKLKLYVNITDENYEIIGDDLQLGEAVRNLIENSVHYTIKGSISISLHHTGNKIIFSVKDTGVGVKKEDRDRMFKTGGVSKDSIKINVGSSGYGLAFVKGVVEKHNGKVWFESHGHNKGSIFYIELPTK